MLKKIKNNIIKRFYQGCLNMALEKIDNGEEGFELAIRFFKYKIYILSK